MREPPRVGFYNSLDPIEQEEIKIEIEKRIPDFWKEKLNKGRVKGETSKLLEAALEEERREIIKEWIGDKKKFLSYVKI